MAGAPYGEMAAGCEHLRSLPAPHMGIHPVPRGRHVDKLEGVRFGRSPLLEGRRYDRYVRVRSQISTSLACQRGTQLRRGDPKSPCCQWQRCLAGAASDLEKVGRGPYATCPRAGRGRGRPDSPDERIGRATRRCRKSSAGPHRGPCRLSSHPRWPPDDGRHTWRVPTVHGEFAGYGLNKPCMGPDQTVVDGRVGSGQQASRCQVSHRSSKGPVR